MNENQPPVTSDEEKELEIEISNLKMRYPNHREYLEYRGAGGFYPTNAAIKRKYDELIHMEASAQIDSARGMRNARAKELERQRVESEIRKQSETEYEQEIANLVNILEKYPVDADYLSLAEDHKARSGFISV